MSFDIGKDMHSVTIARSQCYFLSYIILLRLYDRKFWLLATWLASNHNDRRWTLSFMRRIASFSIIRVIAAAAAGSGIIT